jgi:hypothetical protein
VAGDSLAPAGFDLETGGSLGTAEKRTDGPSFFRRGHPLAIQPLGDSLRPSKSAEASSQTRLLPQPKNDLSCATTLPQFRVSTNALPVIRW